MNNYKSISEYISAQPNGVRIKLNKVRETIQKAAPNATEAISYQMPTFKVNGKNLIHFAAYKNHIGIYPTPDAITEFDSELLKYKKSKGTIQIPLDKPVPYDFISKIVKFRVDRVSK